MPALLSYILKPFRCGWWMPLAAAVLIPSYTASGAEQSAARQWNEELLDAIRLDIPHPPKHARNLFHTSAAMYGAWAAYDPVAVGYVFDENVEPLPADVEAARREAISYAAYRVLRERFASSVNSETILPSIDARLESMGYSPETGQEPATDANTPAEVGKRAGDALLAWGAGDGFEDPGYAEEYDSSVNPNVDVPLSVLGMNKRFMSNMPLGFGIPEETHPNYWQPLDLSTSITQNGLPVPGGQQPYVGVEGLGTTAFSLSRADASKPWIDSFGGPSQLSLPGSPSETDAKYKNEALEVLIASSRLNDGTVIDISPGAIGNNPLGTNDGEGFDLNPVTGEPFEPNPVTRGDFGRSIAEYWADGPDSETPPGHWHVLANEIADRPGFEKRIGGVGPEVNDLEWDVKVYFALSAGTHEAACAAWSVKRYYSGMRPITMIRYMGSRGQSSDPDGPSYHSQGLPLLDGVVEVITAETAAEGGRHFEIWDVATWSFQPGTEFLGEIAVYSWPGEHEDNEPPPAAAAHQSEVTWMLAKDWLPFQRKTFNTPAFPGYVSGHSTFSRAGAEVLTKLTGSPYFPGGLHSHTVERNSMIIDLGPSEDVELQWCSYYDAADQAGQSRIHGGIHPPEDDFPGRHIGSQAGKSAFALAEKYWTGTIVEEPVRVSVALEEGEPAVRWNAVRGMYHKIQYSEDLINWHDATDFTLSYDTNKSWADPDPPAQGRFYRVVWASTPES